MKKHNLLYTLLLSLFLGFLGFSAWASKPDKKLIERGKYLVQVSGCNDCHTPGYLMSEGKTPEKDWLKGDTFGWHGPWGTTYPPNLRLFVKDLSEAQWIHEAKTLKRRPPMPWFNLNIMSDDDLRAMYHFIKSLGDPGLPAPAYIPPDKQPPMPYASFPAPPPGS
jgi:mono/diheme cytochrome c family protein